MDNTLEEKENWQEPNDYPLDDTVSLPSSTTGEENAESEEAPILGQPQPEDDVDLDEQPEDEAGDDEIKLAENDEPDEQEEPSGSVHFGVINRLFDFVERFEEAERHNVENISAIANDVSGGQEKPAILEHPMPTGESKLIYTLQLPEITEVDDETKEESDNQGSSANRTNILKGLPDLLLLHFWIGLRDGIDFETEETKPDGARFAVEVFTPQNPALPIPERRFECFSDTCAWQEHQVDLTDLAGQEVQVCFITHCGENGNTNYDWALWGDPNLLRLKQTETPEDLMAGLAIGVSSSEDSLTVQTFSWDKFQKAKVAVSEIEQQLVAILNEPIEEMVLYAEQPKIVIKQTSTRDALICAKRDFNYQCIVENRGRVPIRPRNRSSVAISKLKLRRGKGTQGIRALAPGDEHTLSWNIRGFGKPAKANVEFSLRYRTTEKLHRDIVGSQVQVQEAMPRLSLQTATELRTYQVEQHVVTENRNLRAVFVHGSKGFEYVAFYVTKNGTYYQVAVSRSISEIRYRSPNSGQTERLSIMPSRFILSGNSIGASSVIFSDEIEDTKGTIWNFEGRFTLSAEGTRIQTAYKLSCSQDQQLLHFQGITLHVGEKNFGSAKSSALFPGLEFLKGDEISSSTRDCAPPINNRLAPHPHKITIPLMAIEHKNTLVGLIWNGLQGWDGQNQHPGAVFSSPNRHEQQDNHLMGLFVPTAVSWMPENSLEATTPYPLSSQNYLSLRAEIVLDGQATLLDIIDHWIDAFGKPSIQRPPREDLEELALSRHAFLETVWDEEERQSRHHVGSPSVNAPGFATLLWFDYLVTQDQSAKEHALEIAKNTIEADGNHGLVSEAGCHILKWELPFYYGRLMSSIDQLKAQIQDLMGHQSEDGGWGFHPTTDRAQTLGQEGENVVGTEALNAYKLLKYARITNDQQALDAGLNALAFMEQFIVPRGAQGWESPIQEPDILSAAYAVGASVEAYLITQEEAFLEQASYWAKTGLPFLYFWYLPDRPAMQFASIPVFGTTFHSHSWFGVPVQWCGLVYAYFLQHLAPHTDFFWQQIAEGILVSAMRQQWTEGELKGTYPDGFYNYCSDRRGPHLNPENILVNMFALRDLDPDISTGVIHCRNLRLHVSSGARVEEISTTENGGVHFRLRYVQFETSYSLIAGLPSPPHSLHVRDGEPIPAVTDLDMLDSGQSGWIYRQADHLLFVRCYHSVGTVDFELSPDLSSFPEPELLRPLLEQEPIEGEIHSEEE